MVIQSNEEKRIFLVNCNNTQTSIESVLLKNNYKVFKQKCAENIFELHPDVILFNVDEDNFGKLRDLQNLNKENIPIIMIAEHYTAEMIQEGYSLGIQDFLHVPYLEAEITHKVNSAIYQEFLKKELQFNINLIHEYKIAIDRSTIVSKTDPKGIITYVNKAFLDISGYSLEELIGKPHNIVRHPDMPKEIFKELWQTISSKKSWHGILKNRKKDGGYYWVKTVINPIVDYRGNIIEYISIRSDVTEMQDLQENFKNELNITTSNYKEVYQLYREYEKAIDESNILSRTNTKGEITYVNKEFEKVTGYKLEELIGKNHSLLRHPDTSDEVLRDLWKTIANGKIWKGLIKNKAKSGEPYWVNSVILPIKNTKGKIIEYMSIRNDVTEIIHLHEEIENTQKELIYRMGAIAESRSKETGDHIKRVAAYAKELAKHYGLSEDECELLYMASPMHDIGKLNTPDKVLTKAGKLDPDEWEIMKQHAQVGYELLNSDKPILQAAAIIAHQHHEKWDGSGYPRGLVGEEIHIYGRITAIVDVFDALGHDRVYKKAWELKNILALFQEERGKHFDPKLIDLFFENLEHFLEIKDSFDANKLSV